LGVKKRGVVDLKQGLFSRDLQSLLLPDMFFVLLGPGCFEVVTKIVLHVKLVFSVGISQDGAKGAPSCEVSESEVPLMLDYTWSKMSLEIHS
jgi:hypothetical protein